MELRSSEQCLCRDRALEQARQQLTSSFASERDALLKEVQLTKQRQQQALAQAQTGDSHCVTCLAASGIAGTCHSALAIQPRYCAADTQS